MNRKERRAPLRDEQVITVRVPNNPKIEGTAAHHMFEQYRKAKTVGEYITAVRLSADERRDMGLPRRGDCGRSSLWWGLERGFIRVD
jgi:hypothetical protein